MRLKAGAIRELHWHKEAEWALVLAGRVRITAVDPDGRNFIHDVGVGDIWNFPSTIPHSIQGLEEGAEFLLVFDDGAFAKTRLSDDRLVRSYAARGAGKNFGVPESSFNCLPKDVDHTRYIFNGKVPPPLAVDAVQSPEWSSHI